MGQRFLKIYSKVDLKQVKEHLLIYGDLSGNCANCNNIDIKIGDLKCPKCQTTFEYIAFRNIKNHMPKVQQLRDKNPNLVFVDHEDFQRNLGSLKAEEFLK